VAVTHLIPGPAIFSILIHQVDDISCWCDPELYQVCPVCHAAWPRDWCFTCNNAGVVPEYGPDQPYYIRHHMQVFPPLVLARPRP
jgi:hypothetical protein